jgi:hypothetical protein
VEIISSISWGNFSVLKPYKLCYMAVDARKEAISRISLKGMV